MTDDQWFTLARVLFYACFAMISSVAILSFLAYRRVTHGTRYLQLVLIWLVAVGGSMVGSAIVAILGYIFAEDQRYGELLGAGIGMLFSIPIGVVAGCVAGTMIAALLIYINFWRPTLVASAGAIVVGAFVSAVVLVPVGWFFWALSTI